MILTMVIKDFLNYEQETAKEQRNSKSKNSGKKFGKSKQALKIERVMVFTVGASVLVLSSI